MAGAWVRMGVGALEWDRTGKGYEGFWDEGKLLFLLSGDYVYALTLWQVIECYTNDYVLLHMYYTLQV